jgi:peptidoglycan glycosyltransferase
MSLVLKRRMLRARAAEPAWPRWALFLLAGTGFVLVAVAVGVGSLFALYATYASGYVPIETKLVEDARGLTEVYDRGGPDSGVFLGTLENLHGQLVNPVSLEDISPWMINATISTEDNTFWTNPGVNPAGLVRAARENLAGGGIGSGTGGSSITQQLVKNVYLSDDCQVIDEQRVCTAPRTLTRKFKEVIYALEVTGDYPKGRILEWYLNQISYADRYVGVESAAQGYFHKPAKDLTLAEAALLAGIPAAPTDYHPRLNCLRDDNGQCVLDEEGRTTLAGNAKERQEAVLHLMVDHGHATREEADAALAEDVRVFPRGEDNQANAWIDNQVEPRLVRMCEAGILPKIPGAENCVESVHSAGYKVTSTLDWVETQRAVGMMREFIAGGLESGCDCHNAAIATIDPGSGQVIVYAPNIDPTLVSDPRVAGNIDQLTEINQPGSSFKPAVYLAWFDRLDKTPMSSIWDTSPMPLDKEKKVVITNPRRGAGSEGLISARAGLGGSQNVPAFRAAAEVGVENVIATAKALGLTTLDQRFDPTFQDHAAVIYGPSVATGGANIRAIDMAYMNATIANMGLMVGVPTLARTIDLDRLEQFNTDNSDDVAVASRQKLDFARGHIRLPGSRELDPVTILEVRSLDGRVLYQAGPDVETRQVVNAGSVWMLHSIMSDCTARFIIWGCGASNTDLALDTFVDGVKLPSGVKTGTQQGFTDANDTLATWMNGYSRYAATAVWVGNANKQLVRDGPGANFAAANTTVRLFKTWMGQYHHDLKEKQIFVTPANFDSLKPDNVTYGRFQSATTDRGRRGGCSQRVDTWMRTDIKYTGDCVNGAMPLPDFKPELALALARSRGITVRGANGAVLSSAPPTATPTEQQQPAQQTPAATPSPAQPTAPPPTATPQATPTPAPTEAPATPTPQATAPPANTPQPTPAN